MLVCFVEADRSKFGKTLDQLPLRASERGRVRVQHDECAEKSRFADQRKDTEILSGVTACFHDGSPEFRYRTNTIQIDATEFLRVAGTVGEENSEISALIRSKNQSMR